jgi:BolA protein
MTSQLNVERMQRMRDRLQKSLAPLHMDLVDESHKHVGHAGARDGRGHFALSIVSEHFTGLNLLQRHRCVYEALGEMMITDIHALSVGAKAPEEA